MNKSPKMVYLILILTLNFSCVDKKTSEPEISKSLLEDLSKSDTLKFTSGVRSIFQDSKGNYWFGSHNEGVCLFDGKSFEYFTTNEGLADNQVCSIQEDSNGKIWLVTGNGVSSYDGKEITQHTSKSAFLANQPFQSGWKKTEGDLWFSAGNSPGVYRYDGQKLDYLEFPYTKIVKYDNPYFVTDFSKGKDKMLWIATFGGVFGYNGENFIVIDDEYLGLTKETGRLHIRSILEDSKGNLWIGNNGIGVLLKTGDTVVNFSEKMELVSANSSKDGTHSPAGTLEHVFVIEEDSHGNIWFGDRDNGVWKYDGESIKNYVIDENLKTQMIWDIYEDKNGNLLFGMTSGGVYKFDGESFDKKF